MKNYYFSIIIILSIAFTSSCSKNVKIVPDPLVSHIDSTINPGDDFFLYANGKWFKQNPIPASESANGIDRIIQDTINAQIRKICESTSKSVNPLGSNKQKIGDFFITGMDSITLNKKGIADLVPELNKITTISNFKDLAREAAYIHSISGSPLFEFWITQDDKISSKNAIFFWQGGLSLPDRNFYFDNDKRALNIRQEFNKYITNIFKIIGYNPVEAQNASIEIMTIETALAKSSRRREDTRDPLKNYHKLSFKEFQKTVPYFDWELFLRECGIQKADSVIIGQPEFLLAMDGYLKSFALENWKNYLKFHLLVNLSRYLDDKTFMETFHFYSSLLRGIKEPKPRWKRVIENTDNKLGEIIGQIYVKDYLPKGTKEKLLEIGNAIRDEFAVRINNLDWMSSPTKEKALNKLKSITMKMGYPDKWKETRNLKIDRSSYVRNVIQVNLWAFNYMVSKFGKPVDRTEWDIEPQTWDAYYNPSNNEIVMPGCNIIVPGYEHKLADDAILYSAVGGSFIGHEITHGFDDQGCKYDEKGNLHNWWLPGDSVNFYKKTKLIIKQFNGYIAVDSLHINGELTQGENIADLGGVIMGYEAYKKTKEYKSKKMIGGVTPDQRYFLGYALAWMINERPEAIATQVRSNEHSPVKFRVIGPLSNIPEFYAAFDIKPGQPMWRPDILRVRIW